jgi:hypothetical protein
VESLVFEYFDIPESVNKLYFVHGGRKVLSTQGRAYKNRFLLTRGGLSVEDLMAFQPDPLKPYRLELVFFLGTDRIYNTKFGKTKTVKYKFGNIDTSNMIKLFEDCISELTGISDRNNFTVVAHKRDAKGRPEKVRAFLAPIDLGDVDEYGRLPFEEAPQERPASG